MGLFPYQVVGADWLQKDPRRYLADEMGLGKTVQVLSAWQQQGVRRACVVAPASAVPNWYAEGEIWAPDVKLSVVSYTRLALNPHLAEGQDWEAVALDEAHYVKNRKAKRTKAALDKLAARCEMATLVSGTPMPNHPGELFAPMNALWPDLLREHGIKTYMQWFGRFTKWIDGQYGPKPYGVRNTELLREIMGQVMLRRTIETVAMELPPLRVTTHWLEKDTALDKAVREMGLDAAILHDAMDNAANASALRRVLGAYKVPRIAEIVAEELDTGQYKKIVVLAYHRESLEILRSRLAEFGVVGFDGSTPQGKRQEAIDAFKHGTARVFVAQQTAAGVAINLQVASEIVLAEPAWSPDDNRQAIKRIHRIGQDAPCRARIFAVKGTLDEPLMRTITTKSRMQEEVGL